VNLIAGPSANVSFGFVDTITVANTMKIGALSGGGTFQGSFNGTVFNTLEVGNLNTNSTFSGVLGRNTNNMMRLNLTKVGSGTLTLSGVNINTGATLVSAGTLKVASGGSIAASSGVTINGSGATLAGAGTASAITLTLGTIAPGDSGIGTLTGSSFTWTAGNNLTFDLSSSDNTADKLSLSGAFTKSGSGTFNFDFNGGLANQTYTLATFGAGNTTFSTSDFAVGSGIGGTFTLDSVGGTLTFTAVPEPHEFALAIVGLVCVTVVIRRRNHQA